MSRADLSYSRAGGRPTVHVDADAIADEGWYGLDGAPDVRGVDATVFARVEKRGYD